MDHRSGDPAVLGSDLHITGGRHRVIRRRHYCCRQRCLNLLYQGTQVSLDARVLFQQIRQPHLPDLFQIRLCPRQFLVSDAFELLPRLIEPTLDQLGPVLIPRPSRCANLRLAASHASVVAAATTVLPASDASATKASASISLPLLAACDLNVARSSDNTDISPRSPARPQLMSRIDRPTVVLPKSAVESHPAALVAIDSTKIVAR
jgi:hypothetical protein